MPEASSRCPHCDAHVRDWYTHCTQCDQPLSAASPELASPYAPPQGEPDPDDDLPGVDLTSFSLRELLLLMALVGVVCASWVVAPGLGVIVTLVAAPVAVRTYLVLRVRKARGVPTTRMQRFGLMLASTGVALGLLSILALLLSASAVVGVLIACFGAFGGQGGADWHNYPGMMALAGLTTGSVLLVGWFGWKIIRRRWSDDTRK